MASSRARRLAHVLWLGGSSCAGKSRVADLLAARHDLAVYHCDDHFDAHSRRLDPLRHPHFLRIRDLSPEQLWMRPVADQVAELAGFYAEELEMVIEDLLALPAGRPVLVEGSGLAPGRIAGLIRDRGQAFWLVPTAAFRRRVYPERGAFVGELLAQCADPETAFENWMRRDEERTRLLIREVDALGLARLEVDGSRDVEQIAKSVARHFALIRELGG